MRASIIVATIIALALPAVGQAASLDPLRLICVGAGTARKVDRENAFVSNNAGQSASGYVNRQRSESFDDEVRVELDGESGRVRIPQALLPPIRVGNEGWMDIRKVEATSDLITATATINLFNKAKLRLDRITGILSMTTLDGSFRGECTPYDPATTQRRF